MPILYLRAYTARRTEQVGLEAMLEICIREVLCSESRVFVVFLSIARKVLG
jgi:hypothetical protein